MIHQDFLASKTQGSLSLNLGLQVCTNVPNLKKKKKKKSLGPGDLSSGQQVLY